MDPDSLTVTVLVPENAMSPIGVFDTKAALQAAIVERDAARHLPDDWDAAGLYILVDRCDSDGGWGVYVGKAPSGIRDRIKDHLRNKDTWYRALLVRRDTTHGFNSAQIGWLEGRLYDLLKASDGVRLSNKVRPGDETLAPYDRDALEMVLVSLQRLMRLMGHDPSSGDDTDTVAGMASVATTPMSEKKVLYIDWWTEFLPALREAYPDWIGDRTPSSDNWMTFRSGRSDILYGLSFPILTGTSNYRLQAHVYIADGESAYRALAAQRSAIEEACDLTLQWEPGENTRHSRVAVYLDPADPADRKSWPTYRAWAVETLGELRGVFKEPIKALPPFDGQAG